MMVKNNNCMRKWYWWRWEWRWRLKSVIVSHVFELRQSRWLQRGKKKIERSGSSDTSYLVFIDRSCDKHVIQSRKSGLRNIHTLHILLLPPQRGFSGTYNIQRWAVCSHVLSLRDSTYQSKENEHDKSQIPRVFQWPPVLLEEVLVCSLSLFFAKFAELSLAYLQSWENEVTLEQAVKVSKQNGQWNE